MPWRDSHALHIFAPSEEPYDDNWVEQILGTTIKPIYRQFQNDIRWLWVTRYSGQYNEAAPPVNCPLQERYRLNEYYRFIVFRTSVDGASKSRLHEQAIHLAGKAGCFTDPRGWLDYDVVADLGGDRFIRPDALFDERSRRAHLIVYFVSGTIKLMLDLLVQDSKGRWTLEQSKNKENPNGSVFESIHHLFCNATGVPTTVLLFRRGDQFQIRTFWMPPISLPFNPKEDFNWQVPLGF